MKVIELHKGSAISLLDGSDFTCESYNGSIVYGTKEEMVYPDTYDGDIDYTNGKIVKTDKEFTLEDLSHEADNGREHVKYVWKEV